MKQFAQFDQRPLLVAIAGSNGAGKTTFYHAHLESAGLRFVNADVLARELNLDAYAAAKVADALRRELVQRHESFAFETVFSDSTRDKLDFLLNAIQSGYTVVLCFIGIASPEMSDERVAMRVSQGGHDVPADKVKSRFPRTLVNLKTAILELPNVLIYDNSDLRHPFRRIAAFHNGRTVYGSKRVPAWFKQIGV